MRAPSPCLQKRQGFNLIAFLKTPYVSWVGLISDWRMDCCGGHARSTLAKPLPARVPACGASLDATLSGRQPACLQGMMAGFMLFSVFIMPKLKIDPEVRPAVLTNLGLLCSKPAVLRLLRAEVVEQCVKLQPAPQLGQGPLSATAGNRVFGWRCGPSALFSVARPPAGVCGNEAGAVQGGGEREGEVCGRAASRRLSQAAALSRTEPAQGPLARGWGCRSGTCPFAVASVYSTLPPSSTPVQHYFKHL